MATATNGASAPAAPAEKSAPAAPAAPESAPAAPAIDIAELIAAPERREPAFRIPSGAPSVPFGDFTLSVGVSTRGASKGTPHMVLSLGAQQQGFSKSAIAVAILNDLIPREEIRALWAAADAARAK